MKSIRRRLSTDEDETSRANEKGGSRMEKERPEDVKKSLSLDDKADYRKKSSRSDRDYEKSNSLSPERKKGRDEKSAGSSRESERERDEDFIKDRNKRRKRSQERSGRDHDADFRRDDRRSDYRDRRRDRSGERKKSDNCKLGRRDDRSAKSDARWRRNDRSGRDYDRRRRGNDRSDRRSRDGEEESNSDRPAWATKAVIKRAEEIQQRKLLWGKHDEKKEDESASADKSSSKLSTTSTWNSILAATSSDSKQLDKFKRLMGIKKTDDLPTEPGDVNQAQLEAERERQRALYKNLDQQYAIARSTTHLGRGQGLGFHQ